MEISSGNTVEHLCAGLFLVVLQLLSHIVIHIVKGCSIVNEADIFLELSCFCYDLTTVVLEKTLESPLDCNEIQPVHSEGDQSWDFFGRTDAKAETPLLWPPHAKSCLIGKDPDAGRDWGQEEKGTTEDEMPGWHR